MTKEQSSQAFQCRSTAQRYLDEKHLVDTIYLTISHILTLLFRRSAMATDKNTTCESRLLDNKIGTASAKANQETVDESVVACKPIPAKPFDFLYTV